MLFAKVKESEQEALKQALKKAKKTKWYQRLKSVEMSAQGQKVASVKRGFVGEMNVMEPGPASATVVTNIPSRIFSVPGAILRKLAASDSEFRAYLELHLSQATRSKLVEANKRLSQSS